LTANVSGKRRSKQTQEQKTDKQTNKNFYFNRIIKKAKKQNQDHSNKDMSRLRS